MDKSELTLGSRYAIRYKDEFAASIGQGDGCSYFGDGILISLTLNACNDIENLLTFLIDPEMIPEKDRQIVFEHIDNGRFEEICNMMANERLSPFVALFREQDVFHLESPSEETFQLRK